MNLPDKPKAVEQDWTPTPWKEWHGDIVANGDKLSDYDDYVIAGMGRSYGSRSSVYSPVKITTPEGKANASRIVAAVNATSALSTESLEAGAVDKLLQFMIDAAGYEISEPYFAAQDLLKEIGVE